MDIFKKKKRRFTGDFTKISKFLKEEKGVTVKLGETTEFLGPFTREVIIHHNYDLRNNGLYMLLHESGRVFQPFSTKPTLDKETHREEYITRKILSEIETWKLGRNIARKLKISINDKKWKEHIERGITKILKET